jgi:hypothetical protein
MPQAIDQLHGGLEAIRQQQYLYTYDNSDIDETLDRAKDDLLDAIEHVAESRLALQSAVNRLASVGAEPLPAPRPGE